MSGARCKRLALVLLALAAHAQEGNATSSIIPRAARFAYAAKRGLCWQFKDVALGAKPAQPFKNVSWWYNWGPAPFAEEKAMAQYAAKEGIEFVPMQWSKWSIADLDRYMASRPLGSRVLLGFNEPNHGWDQGHLTAKEAAAFWKSHMQPVADRQLYGLRLGSPAAAPCGSSDCIEKDPFKWWDDFFKACKGCRVDFMATHYYACSTSGLKSYLEKVRSKYKRPVWLTEFACPSNAGTASKRAQINQDYFAAAARWMDGKDWIERYAWFAISVKDFKWLDGASMWDWTKAKMLPLGKLYNGQRYSSKAPLPGVHPAALAPWVATGKNTPRPSAAVPGRSVTGWWQLPSPASARIEPTPGLPDWSDACGACAAVTSVEALPLGLQDRCRLECGFWSRREAAAVRRSLRELAHRAAEEAAGGAAGGTAAPPRRLLGA
ncbi:glycoside hydrolase family 128 [Chlorella sorokiniana]|uniref:Glycoside hydrolase family 128 n=1 Tax=Chlorella sorokiniana TaxID=3076 RepID=A0A2P6TIG8_CHLSO|nr:glycoside hydrolase family 128 [Chlorella sorokiniana]|eukprot:PRW34088.1 glycoside hydrolase family 128 [Chlorella sorokiniana]